MSSIPGALQLQSLRDRPKTNYAGTVGWYVVGVEQYIHDPQESVCCSCNQLRTWGRA